MKNLTLYKVVNPVPKHEIYKNCIGISPGLFMTIYSDPSYNVCLKFRSGVSPKLSNVKFVDKPFVTDDFNESEVEEVVDENIEDFWNDDKFIYSKLEVLKHETNQ